MSNFGAKLEELIGRANTTCAEISRASNTTEGLMSRWIRGRQTYVSHKHLESLSTVISSDPAISAELIMAHLRDENVGQGSELIKIEIKGGSKLKEDTTPYYVGLPPKIQNELGLIGQVALRDPDMRSMLTTLSKLASKQSISGE